MSKMVIRIIQNFYALKAERLIRSGKSTQAIDIIQRLMRKCPNSVAYNLLFADFTLFAGDHKEALAQYALSKRILEDKKLLQSDRRFLNAYINFRTLAIGYHIAGQEFENAQEFAIMINGLEAQKKFKRRFSIPE